jgi:hypothetical protein
MQEPIENTEKMGLLALIVDVAGKGVAIINGAIDQIASEGRDAWLALKSMSETAKAGFRNKIAHYIAEKSRQEQHKAVLTHSVNMASRFAVAPAKSFGIAA